jgi:nucleotide-binding universal stress UspA family protein
MAHILLPTDFSDSSLNACSYALDLFGSAGNTFTLVHSYMDPVPGYAAMVDMSSALYASSVEGMADFAKRFQALKSSAGTVVFTDVVYGPFTTVLPDVFREKGADIIVMGTQGATGSALFGSNAGAVAKSSEVPVLIVPKDARFNGLEHILLADDHISVEPQAMRLLVELARRFAAEVTIAHVQSSEAEEPDARVVAEYDSTLADVEHEFIGVPGDDVALALSNVAERDNVDLVAVLHRHMGFLDGLFHSSVAKHLAMQSRIPLLVLEH